MKLLIIRFSSIGDIVLTTPVVRCLKTQLDDVQIHYATKEQYSFLLEDNPYIDVIHNLKGSLPDFLLELRAEKFDLIIDLHNNLRSTILSIGLGVKRKAFRKLNWEKFLLTQFKMNKLPKIHIVDRYMETVSSLGVSLDEKGLDYFIPAAERFEVDGFGEHFANGYVAFIVGAKFATKQLPAAKIAETVLQSDLAFVLLGGKEDIALGKEVEGLVGNTSNLINKVGMLNFHQSASIVKQASVVVTNDTGLMHVAAAFQKKIISVWGNTVPAFGMYPFADTKFSRIVEVKDLDCRPCSKIGYKKCPKGHFKCMQNIAVSKIVDSL